MLRMFFKFLKQSAQRFKGLRDISYHFSAKEFKLAPKVKYKFPKTFATGYPEATMAVINSDNFHSFLTEEKPNL